MTHEPAEGVADGLPFERLWTPHRLAYITTESPTGDDSGCPFDRVADDDVVGNLVVARGATTYAVLKLHPYNPGHLMVLPYRHVAELEDLTTAESAELTTMTQQAIRALRSTARPHAFNIGMNLGGVAGGSLSEHLHQHVVPRWTGDASFITVIGGTKVLPQLLADTRDLLRSAWPETGGVT